MRFGFTQDLRFALRMLARSPVFTLVAVLSIGLAIGANTTVFTWMESLILDPYPAIPDSSRLVGINRDAAGSHAAGFQPVSYPTFQDWSAGARSLEGMAVFRALRLNLREAGAQQGEPVWGMLVSSGYFDVLRLPAAQGRTFLPEEGKVPSPVAVISDRLWQRQFGRDPGTVGQHVRLNGVDVTIIGVAPAGFGGTMVGLGYDIFLPLTLHAQLTNADEDRLDSRTDSWLQAFGRLKPGVTRNQAQAEIGPLALRVSAEHGEAPPSGATVRLMREQFAGSLFFPLFSALLAITALVLLTACANVGNLLLARATARQKEIGIRLALGAGRARILRQLLTESLLLSCLGGAVGVLIALWGRDLLLAFIPPVAAPLTVSFGLSRTVFGFAFLLTVLAAGFFGLVPAWRQSRTALVPVLKDGARSGGVARSRLRSALVVSQVSFSLVTLVSAALFVRSLGSARGMDLGFSDPGQVLLVTTDMNLAGVREAEGPAVADRLLERVRALPGVRRASLATMIPLGFGGHSNSGITVPGYAPGPDETVSAERVIVGPDYFETMGIELVRGRGLTTADDAAALRVAVVNEAFVRRFWSGQDPLGRQFALGPDLLTVVGIAHDGLYDDLGSGTHPLFYLPLSQLYAPVFTLHLRAQSDPRALVESVRHEFAAVNADLPFLDPRTLAEHIAAATLVQSIGASTLGLLGLFAVVLAGVGLYGVLSYVVGLRAKEMAIRSALGAAPRDLMRLVLREGLLLCVAGIAIGTGLALGAGRLLGSQLLGVSPADPAAFTLAPLLLTVVALTACLLPARRAARVDPLEALKSE